MPQQQGRVGLIEKIGSGFARMKKYCNDANAPVFNLDIDKKFFRIEFFKSKNYLKLAKAGEKPAKGLGEKLGERLGENQKKILEIISRDRFVSIRKLSAKLNISTTAVENNISKLKQKSLLKRAGSAKGGHWEIVEK